MSDEQIPAGLIRHPLGFLELSPKPTLDELRAYYTDRYFDNPNFEVVYDAEERYHKTTAYREAHVVSAASSGRMLDVGCGEGFSLEYFAAAGWQVRGLDFSDDGVRRHVPALADAVIVGDVAEGLDALAARDATFDLVICNNVLEHVLDPLALLDRLRRVLAPRGICRLQVPNDDSLLQRYLVGHGCVPAAFWVAPREHMSYFNAETLAAVLRHLGFATVETLADFPIDLFLLNEHSDYKRNPGVGKAAHRARIDLENLLCRTAVQRLLAFRSGCGRAGIGRNVIVYAACEAEHPLSAVIQGASAP